MNQLKQIGNTQKISSSILAALLRYFIGVLIVAVVTACASTAGLTLQRIHFVNVGDEAIHDLRVKYGDVEVVAIGRTVKHGSAGETYRRPIPKEVSIEWRTSNGTLHKKTIPIAERVTPGEKFEGINIKLNGERLELYKSVGRENDPLFRRDSRIYP